MTPLQVRGEHTLKRTCPKVVGQVSALARRAVGPVTIGRRPLLSGGQRLGGGAA